MCSVGVRSLVSRLPRVPWWVVMLLVLVLFLVGVGFSVVTRLPMAVTCGVPTDRVVVRWLCYLIILLCSLSSRVLLTCFVLMDALVWLVNCF